MSGSLTLNSSLGIHILRGAGQFWAKVDGHGSMSGSLILNFSLGIHILRGEEQFWAKVARRGSMSGILTLNSSFRDSHSAVVQVCF